MNNPARHRKSERGFTLFEVLISLTILVSITALVYTSLSATLRMTEIAQEDAETVNGARVAMLRMQRELSMAFLDPRAYASVRRSSRGGTIIESYKSIFKAEDSSPIDKLNFSSFSHVRLYHGSKEADQTEIGYFGEPDEENPGLYVLMHREAPRIDGEPEDGGVVEILARGVQEMQLTYYDSGQEEWIETWDNEAPETRQRLPKAVAVSLKLVDSAGIVHNYRSRISLQLWRALPPRMMGRPQKKSVQAPRPGTKGRVGPSRNRRRRRRSG